MKNLKKFSIQVFFVRSCEEDVLIQSKSGAVDICAMHARARGASGRYAQEKESAEVCLEPKPVEACLKRGEEKKKDAKRQKRKSVTKNRYF
jgi:hypothetical protein